MAREHCRFNMPAAECVIYISMSMRLRRLWYVAAAVLRTFTLCQRTLLLCLSVGCLQNYLLEQPRTFVAP